jgi:hypothetical protein
LVLSILGLFSVDSRHKVRLVSVLSELEELSETEEFQDRLTPDEELQLDAPVSLTLSSNTGSIGESAGGLTNPMQAIQQANSLAQTLSNRSLVRPLVSGGVGRLSLDSNITGLKGISEMVGAGDDAGVMDRITQEILRQIEKNKVIVAWIFDSSLSLKERREAIADRFDRIYTELDTLGVTESGALLTAVVAVGTQTRFLLDKPTNDSATIKKAIRGIKEDESGRENLFNAVRETALRYRKMQTATRRSLLIVVLTDEVGDDPQNADLTVGMLQQYRVPLYIMGPIASFSRPIIHDHWIDKETGFHFWIPIVRGPYTRKEEFTRLMYDGSVYKSGFGTFALTQMARETGGIYFIYDDDRVPGPKDYDMNILNRYKANYGPEPAYASEINESPLRRTLMEIVEEGNKLWYDWPGWIHHQTWARELDDRQKAIAQHIAFADRAAPRLQSLESLLEKETDQRWRANFHLTYARVLLGKVRSDEYAWACADFKLNPRTLKDPKKNNGWYFAFHTKELHAHQKPGQEPGDSTKKAAAAKLTAPDPKKREAAIALLEASQAHFRRILEAHSGTPWAEAARHEIRLYPGGSWVEAHDPNDLSDPKRAKQYAEAAKRVPKK